MSKGFSFVGSTPIAWLRLALGLGALVAASVAPGVAMAAPDTLQVEGVLTSTGGSPAADGKYNVKFTLYDAATGGATLWSEALTDVALTGGRFQAVLGATSKIDPAKLPVGGAWLGVQVGTDPELERRPLHASVFALRAAWANGVACTGCISADHIANGSIAAAKLGFNYAGSATKGGPAVDVDCTACVSVAELKFDGDVDLGGNSLKAKNGTFSGDVAAKTVTATSFVGDGSKLTGIKTPAGTCKEAGEVVKGINADGTLICAQAMDPNALPKDGIDEISNGLLFNQFKDVIAAKNKNVLIPDNTGAEGISDIDFPDIGVAQALSVTVQVSNTDLSTLALVLLPPDDKKVGYTLCDPCGIKDAKAYKVTFPTDAKLQVGDLGQWIGKNPKGVWNLKAKDTSYCVKQAPGNDALCDLTAKSDGAILDWNIAIQTLSTKKVGVGGNLVLATETAPCDAFAKGAIRYSAGLSAIQVCDGNKWWPEVFGDTKERAALSCKAIKDQAPGVKSGTFWIDPDGAAGSGAPYEAYCDQETGGGGWTLVVKVKGNDPVLNRSNTAQWRNKTPINGQDCKTVKDENALCESYDKVPFTDVMIRSLGKSWRNLAWGHRDPFESMWHVVNAGTRIMTRNRLFGAVENLDYNGENRFHRECAANQYGFFTADWSQHHGGIVGHNMVAGHAGGVLGSSTFDWEAWDGNAWYGYQNFLKTRCLTDFAIGSCYGACESGNNAKSINSHWWGNGNSYSHSWNSHGVFVR